MIRQNMMRLVILLALLVLPAPLLAQETQTPDYWQGWCAGRLAGLSQASHYVQVTQAALLESFGASPDVRALQEAVDKFLMAIPMASAPSPAHAVSDVQSHGATPDVHASQDALNHAMTTTSPPATPAATKTAQPPATPAATKTPTPPAMDAAVSQPLTLDLPDGRTITCPDGDVAGTAKPLRKG